MNIFVTEESQSIKSLVGSFIKLYLTNRIKAAPGQLIVHRLKVAFLKRIPLIFIGVSQNQRPMIKHEPGFQDEFDAFKQMNGGVFELLVFCKVIVP